MKFDNDLSSEPSEIREDDRAILLKPPACRLEL